MQGGKEVAFSNTSQTKRPFWQKYDSSKSCYQSYLCVAAEESNSDFCKVILSRFVQNPILLSFGFVASPSFCTTLKFQRSCKSTAFHKSLFLLSKLLISFQE